jgi:nitrate reductase NapA
MGQGACRFCGTGCSVMVRTKDNRVVATHGDIKSRSIAASTA